MLTLDRVKHVGLNPSQVQYMQR